MHNDSDPNLFTDATGLATPFARPSSARLLLYSFSQLDEAIRVSYKVCFNLAHFPGAARSSGNSTNSSISIGPYK